MRYKAAIVLAAGRCPDDLHQHTGKRLVADLRFGGRSVVDLVVDAFRGADFDKIFVVGTRVEGCEYVHDQGAFTANLRAGLQAADKLGTLFVSTCDMPFLTASEVTGFVSAVKGSALNCSVIPVDRCKSQFPDLARTSLTVAEGEFTLGNIVAGEDWVWRNALPLVEKAFRWRKNKLALAWLMGPKITVGYARAKKRPEVLKIEQLENRVGKMIGMKHGGVRATIGNWPGIGTDIDTLEHYILAQQYFPAPEREEVLA